MYLVYNIILPNLFVLIFNPVLPVYFDSPNESRFLSQTCNLKYEDMA